MIVLNAWRPYQPCLLTFLSLFILFSLCACKSKQDLKPMSYGHANHVNNDCPAIFPNVGNDLCGLYELPLNWTKPEQKQINVFLRSFPLGQNGQQSKGQLWVIDGGPGASGATFSDPKFVELVHSLGWDLYIPTHRGVGFSTHLDCDINYQPFDQWYVDTCAPRLIDGYGDDLNWFSAIGAAYDLNYLITNNNPLDLPVVMMGASYGTFLTQRFIQLFESRIDAAILISGTNVAPEFERVAKLQEDTLKRMLDECDKQAACAQLFRTTAYDAAQELVNNNGWQFCEITQSNSELAKWIIGNLASSSALRKYLPLTIKRLADCNDSDLVFIDKIINDIRAERIKTHQQLFQFNPLMLHHQIMIELMSPEGYSDLGLLPDRAILQSPAGNYIQFKSEWPAQFPPVILPTTLTTQLPVLTLHGGLDMQAPVVWFEELSRQLDGDNQHNILFPNAGHGTPNYTKLNNGENCSWQLVDRFLKIYAEKTSLKELDTSCVSEVEAITFMVE